MTAGAKRQRRKARAEISRERIARDPVRVARKLVTSALEETAKHSILHRLHKRNLITWEQCQAGLRYQQDELASRDTKTSTLDPDAVGRNTGSIPTAKLMHQIDALVAYRDAAKALADHSAVSHWLVDAVAIEERDLIERLRSGLATLSRHYARSDR